MHTGNLSTFCQGVPAYKERGSGAVGASDGDRGQGVTALGTNAQCPRCPEAAGIPFGGSAEYLGTGRWLGCH